MSKNNFQLVDYQEEHP